ILAPWGSENGLGRAVSELRSQGQIVICALPGEAHRFDEFVADRELVLKDGQWVVREIDKTH
ncbi:MAG: ATP phosphoribosyltransferase regulatory subunit, partial [Alcaligenaceae bacterium]|nr:ATP phosphoribosyltransferase regulatory subunit [Alcaligenaceae bacterium]